jgi:PAS domain S-box-containing protein
METDPEADTRAQLEREIAERRRVAAALEESEKRYRTLVGQVKDYAIFSIDRDGRALTWNEGVERVLGYKEEEFVGSSMELPFLPEDIAAGVPRRELETAYREGVASDDRWLRRKDGTRFFAVGLTTRQVDASGRCTGFSKVFRDETRRVLAEAARRAEANRLRTLVQNLRDYAIFMLDTAGLITEWSDGAELVTGFRAEEVLGRHLEVVYVPEDRATGLPHRELEQAARDGRFEREGWCMTRSGERIWVNEIVTAVYEPPGVLTGFTKISRNLTERKRTEDALREADRRKDEFLATLAHELRNPLAPLRHGLTIIRLTNMPGSPLQPTLEMMERQLVHLVRLVDDLLDVARISTGKVALRKAVVPVQKVLAASIEATHALVESREHELTVDPGPQELFVDGDFDRLAQVFSNLISNAAKYMELGGKIAIRVDGGHAHAIVTVADTGIGIPAAELPHIFEIFSQVRSHQHHSQGGLGLGLSVVKSLVAMHGGTVRAHSGGPGRGSEFVVQLPLAMTTGIEEPVLAPAEPPDTTRRRVLVVDDNHDAADSLATLLTLRGHDVVIAYDGEEAIEKAKRFTPDIVMMDLGMPRLDGIEAARRLRALAGGEKLKILALTGWGQLEDRARTRDAGFDFHLVKPLDPAELERVLRG